MSEIQKDILERLNRRPPLAKSADSNASFVQTNTIVDANGDPVKARYLSNRPLLPGAPVASWITDNGDRFYTAKPIERPTEEEARRLLLFYILRYVWEYTPFYTKLKTNYLLSPADIPRFIPEELIFTVDEENPNGKYIQPDFLVGYGALGWWSRSPCSLLYVDGKFIAGFIDDEGGGIVGEADEVYNYSGGGTGNAARWGFPLLFSNDGIQWGSPTIYDDLYARLGFSRFGENDALSVSLYAFSLMSTTYSSDLQTIVHKAVDSIEIYLSNNGKNYPVDASIYPELGNYYLASVDGGNTWRVGLTNENKSGYYTYQSSIPVIENGSILNGIVDYPQEEVRWDSGTLDIIDTFDLLSETIVTDYVSERAVGCYFAINNVISVDTGSSARILLRYGRLRFEVIDVEQIEIALDTVPLEEDEYITIGRDINPGWGAFRRFFRIEADPYHFSIVPGFRTNRIEGDVMQSKIYLVDRSNPTIPATIENLESSRDGNIVNPTYTTDPFISASILTILRSILVTGTIVDGVDLLAFPLSDLSDLGWTIGGVSPSTFRAKYAYTDDEHGQKRLAYSPTVHSLTNIVLTLSYHLVSGSTADSNQIAVSSLSMNSMSTIAISVKALDTENATQVFSSLDVGDTIIITGLVNVTGDGVQTKTQSFAIESPDPLWVKVEDDDDYFVFNIVTPSFDPSRIFIAGEVLVTFGFPFQIARISPSIQEPTIDPDVFVEFVSEIGRLPPYHNQSDWYPVEFTVTQPKSGDTSVTIDTKISKDKNVGIPIYFKDEDDNEYSAFVDSINEDRLTLNFSPALPFADPGDPPIVYQSFVWVYYKDRFQRIGFEFFPFLNREYSLSSGAIRNSQIVVSSINCSTGLTSVVLTHSRLGLPHISGILNIFAIEKPNGEVLPISEEIITDPWDKYCHFFQWQGKNKTIGFIAATFLKIADPQPVVTIPELGIFAEGGYSVIANQTSPDTIVSIFYEGAEIVKTQAQLFPDIVGNIRFDVTYNTTQRSAGNSSVLVIQIQVDGDRKLCINTIANPLVFRIIPNSSLSTMTPNEDGLYNILGTLQPEVPGDERYSALWFDPITDTVNIAYIVRKLNAENILEDYYLYVASTNDGIEWSTTASYSGGITRGEIVPCIYAESKSLFGTKLDPPPIEIN